MNHPVAATAPMSMALLEQVVIGGDLAKLQPQERLQYYAKVCESVGLNPLTKPFEYITLNNKLTLYAKRDCTDQLRKLHGVSCQIVGRDLIGEIYVVTTRARNKTGRNDESTGAVCVTGLKGTDLANSYMKAETKSKRRVTLSICGLGMLDESEVADIDPTTALHSEAPVIQMPKPLERPAEKPTTQEPQAKAPASDPKINATQVNLITKKAHRAGTTPEAVCTEFKVASLAGITQSGVNAVLLWIESQVG